MAMSTYEDRRDTIITHAWETWTKNGLNLDEDMRRESRPFRMRQTVIVCKYSRLRGVVLNL
jgi:hypothetical protein